MTTAARSRNRIAPLLDAPSATTPIIVPSSPAARQGAYAEAVMMAVLTLQKQLAHPDAKIARDAAVAIIDLGKTRLRHGEPVAGTHAPSEILEPLERTPLAPRVGSDGPLAERVEHEDELDDSPRFNEKTRVQLQEIADRTGATLEEVMQAAAQVQERSNRPPTDAHSSS